jgi:hypothetical protein
MAEPLVKTRPRAAGTIMLVAFLAVAIFSVSLALVLVLLAPVSIFIAWRLRRRT